MPADPTHAPDEHQPSGTGGGASTGDVRTDGGGAQPDGGDAPVAHTIRIELVDEPGQLLAALEPIAEHGGNLLSVFHERGNITPRGHIPVAVDLECPPDRFDVILGALRENGVNVTSAGAEEFGAEVTVVLVGHLIDTDLSDTLRRLADCANATVADLELSAPAGAGSDEMSSARLRLRAREGETAEVLETVRSVARGKGVRVIEPMEGHQ